MSEMQSPTVRPFWPLPAASALPVPAAPSASTHAVVARTLRVTMDSLLGRVRSPPTGQVAEAFHTNGNPGHRNVGIQTPPGAAALGRLRRRAVAHARDRG